MKGNSSKAVTTQLMIGLDTFFRWLKWYNEKGLAGIREVSLGGRPDGNPGTNKNLYQSGHRSFNKA